MLIILVGLLVFCQTGSTAFGNSDIKRHQVKEWETNYLVPEQIKPIKYNLLLYPHFQDGTFEGKVRITVNVTSPVSYIPIHVNDLEITKTKIEMGTSKIPFLSAFQYKPNQFWVIKFKRNSKRTLQAGIYVLKLEFRGNTLNKLAGLYQSKFVSSNETRTIVTSKFEPTDARQAFPCFDEPALKARFKVSLVRPKKNKFIALSNMNVIREDPGPTRDTVTVRYAETVPMSTYLACFVIGQFESSGIVTIDNKGTQLPCQVYATPQLVNSTYFAKEIVGSMIKFYIDYFDIAYPLPKLDMIGIPDFTSGAMEHWGLVTYRETALLFDPEKNSITNMERVAQVVAHELAHMWFGNLVTMKWWDDLWLNEGFASFMEYKGVRYGYSQGEEWDMDTNRYITEDLHPVLYLDSVISSHPIIQPVSHPDKISQLFDKISYDKGQAVIRMIEDLLQPETFKKGLKLYLEKFQFSNAVSDDLWSSLSQAADHMYNVKLIADTWTRQKGYPVVSVEFKDDAKTELILTQKRFLLDPHAVYDVNESIYGYKWDIPITYVSDSNETKTVIFKKHVKELIIPISKNTKYVKFNINQVGFYRVNYHSDYLKTFEILLKKNHKIFSSTDRANLLDDVYHLAHANYIHYSTVFQLFQYLPKETDFAPWAVASSKLFKLKLILRETSSYPGFLNFARSLLENKYGEGLDQFHWEYPGEDIYAYRKLRMKMLELICAFGVKDCVKDARSLFLSWLHEDTELDPDTRLSIFKYGLKDATDEEFQLVWDRYKGETNPSEKEKLVHGLSSVKDPKLIHKLLNLTKDEDNVRGQDFFTVLGFIAANPVGSSIVWDFYRLNFQYFIDRFSMASRSFAKSISRITGGFTNKLRLEEVKDLFRKFPEVGAQASNREQALETIKLHIQWVKRNEKRITGWMRDHSF